MMRFLKLTVIWWVAQFLLAVPVAVIFWGWLAPHVAYSPGTDALLTGLNLGVLADLIRADRGMVLRAAWTSALTMAVMSAVIAPLAIGGALGVLRSDGTRAIATFLRSAADTFGPIMLIGALTRSLAIGLGLLTAGILSNVPGLLGGEFWEPGPIVGAALALVGGLFVWWCLIAIGDLAIVLRTEAPTRGAWRALGGGVAILVRHPLTLARRWLFAFVIPAGLVQVIYVLGSDRLLTAPLALFAAQQLVMLTRAGCRVELLALERRLVLSRRRIPLPRQEDQVRPGQDGERQIEEREEAQRPVQLEPVQEDGAAHGDQLGEGQPGPDAGVPERVGDDRVALGEPESGDAQVREDPVKGL
jgi:hypothetical protein